MSNVLEWKETNGVGPTTYYGYWDGAKCFSVFLELKHKGATPAKYCIKSILPGFRPDLPLQNTVEEAQAFCERMLERWVAKRGLLFKARIVISDVMVQTAYNALDRIVDAKFDGHVERMDDGDWDEALREVIKQAITAREPHAASNANQANTRNTIPTKRAPANVR